MMDDITAFLFSVLLIAIFSYMIMRIVKAMKVEYIFFKEFTEECVIKKSAVNNINHPSVFTDKFNKHILDKFEKQKPGKIGN